MQVEGGSCTQGRRSSLESGLRRVSCTLPNGLGFSGLVFRYFFLIVLGGSGSFVSSSANGETLGYSPLQ